MKPGGKHARLKKLRMTPGKPQMPLAGKLTKAVSKIKKTISANCTYCFYLKKHKNTKSDVQETKQKSDGDKPYKASAIIQKISNYSQPLKSNLMHTQISNLYAVLYDFLENIGLDEEPNIAILSFAGERQNEKSHFCEKSNTVFLNISHFKTLENYHIASAMLSEVFKYLKIDNKNSTQKFKF